MAVHEYAIVSLDDLKKWLGITVDDDNDILELIINGITDEIENYCDRRIVARDDDITETFSGDATKTRFVQNPPINSITSIAVEGAPDIDPDDDDGVRYDSALGKIYLLRQTFAEGLPQNCEIVYSGGYSTVPSNLWLAAAKLMKLVYLQRDANKELIRAVSSSLTGERVEYLEDIMTPDIKRVLDKYVLRRYP